MVTAEAEEVGGGLILTPVPVALQYLSSGASPLLWAGIACRVCGDASVKSDSLFPFFLCLLPLGSSLCKGIGVLAGGQELVLFLGCVCREFPATNCSCPEQGRWRRSGDLTGFPLVGEGS